MINMEGSWEKKTKASWNNKAVCGFNAFPVLFVYTIWEAQNRAIFKNLWTPTDISLQLYWCRKHKNIDLPPKLENQELLQLICLKKFIRGIYLMMPIKVTLPLEGKEV